ncbi:hypothetical protein [Xanthobacter sp. VNH20]|uniref:hypothetical protein n=1 Tax=Xanthobacter sp. VNH20 TaxID=3156616 RepID=UPI0032B3DAA9
MMLQDEIRAIETRLAAFGIPLARLLDEAKIDRSTWGRWRSGNFSPRLMNWYAAKDAVERVIAARVTAAAPTARACTRRGARP